MKAQSTVWLTFLRSDPPNATLLASSMVSHTTALPHANCSALCIQRIYYTYILFPLLCVSISIHVQAASHYHINNNTIVMVTNLFLCAYTCIKYNMHTVLTLIWGGSYRMTSNTSLVLPPSCLHTHTYKHTHTSI